VQRARELGLKMVIVPGSQLHQLPEGLDSTEFAAIVGNLLDNAFSGRSDDGGRLVCAYHRPFYVSGLYRRVFYVELFTAESHYSG
ncbi:hypothetical protein MJL81_28685, partial [Salmonella enterica subsp. enterica serovar Anatum]|nr:hypothetical protein [Salmonella enterica subsp. enterica serovar Anatum]